MLEQVRPKLIAAMRIALYLTMLAAAAYVVACADLPPETYTDAGGNCRRSATGEPCEGNP